MHVSQPTQFRAVWILLSLYLVTTGRSSSATPVTHQCEYPPTPVATLQDIMVAEVDPSADALWDAVAYVSTLEGKQDHRPRSEEKWQALRRSAIVLIEATNLLKFRHRPVGAVSRPPASGELNAAEIRRRVDSTRGSFDQFADVLRSASMSALTAIEKRSPNALFEAGAKIDTACEACHRAYWYPDQG